jgi:hypothetical protein
MNGHFGVKIIILKPLLTKQISKLRAVWGKQFEKGDKESEEIVLKKGRNEKRKKQKRKK